MNLTTNPSVCNNLEWVPHNRLPARIAIRKLFCAGAILVLFLAPISTLAETPAGGQSAAKNYFDSARKALAAGDRAGAIAKLKQAIEADPKFADAHLLLGLAEFQNGNTASAVKSYKQAIAVQPRSYAGHYNLALAYLREHQLDEGRVQLEEAVKLNPRQADAAYDLGVVLLELGKPSDALPHLIRASVLDARRPDAAFNLIRAELETGCISEATAEAQAAAKRFGANFQWNAAVGDLFLKNAQPKEATSYLSAAHVANPGDSEIRQKLALAYLSAGDGAQVLQLIGDPKTGIDHYLRGSAYYLDHNFPEADRESEAALSLAPENPQILVLRTRLSQRAGQQDAALESAQKAASLAPTWSDPYYLSGVSLYFLRRYAEASQNLSKAVELDPNSARAFFLQGISLASQGKDQEAEQSMRRAVALQPSNARFHCHLGILLSRENRYPEAEASFRNAIAANSAYALSHYELGKLLVRDEQSQAAAVEFEQAVAHDPTLGSAFYQLSRVYVKLGENEKSQRALAEFRKLRRQENEEANDSQTAEDDAKKEASAPETP